jgi:hypothetical protein
MTRKDSEKDSERPHYYSQFWLDVAAGRRVIGAPRPEEDGEAVDADSDSEIPEPVVLRRNRLSDDGNGQSDQIVHPVAEPVRTPQDFIDPDREDDISIPAIQEESDYQDDVIEDTDVPDMDLEADAVDEDEDEDEEVVKEVEGEDEDEEEEEEDDDMNWGRGRKKAKPTRAVKPVVKKPGKRDTRRPY